MNDSIGRGHCHSLGSPSLSGSEVADDSPEEAPSERYAAPRYAPDAPNERSERISGD